MTILKKNQFLGKKLIKIISSVTKTTDVQCIKNIFLFSNLRLQIFTLYNLKIIIIMTSLPYFGVKLSCVCFMFADRKI